MNLLYSVKHKLLCDKLDAVKHYMKQKWLTPWTKVEFIFKQM